MLEKEGAKDRNGKVLLRDKQMRHLRALRGQLKAAEQVLWVRRMNGIRERAEKVVRKEIIYS